MTDSSERRSVPPMAGEKVKDKPLQYGGFISALGRTRTCDLPGFQEDELSAVRRIRAKRSSRPFESPICFELGKKKPSWHCHVGGGCQPGNNSVVALLLPQLHKP